MKLNSSYCARENIQDSNIVTDTGNSTQIKGLVPWVALPGDRAQQLSQRRDSRSTDQISQRSAPVNAAARTRTFNGDLALALPKSPRFHPRSLVRPQIDQPVSCKPRHRCPEVHKRKHKRHRVAGVDVASHALTELFIDPKRASVYLYMFVSASSPSAAAHFHHPNRHPKPPHGY